MQFSIEKDIKQVTKEDLQKLVDGRKQEDAFLDFKRDLYGKNDSDKKELLKDVSAFANATGGEIIIGIEEDNFNQARSLYGFTTENIAVEKNRIEQIILNGLEPKFNDFEVRYISLDNNRYAMIIRIKHSLLFPHMVSHQKFNKFYIRRSDKNLLLDVYELRNLFLRSENFMQEIRKYNQERIAAIINNNPIIPIIEGAKLLINFVPFNALLKQNNLNLAKSDIKLNFPEQRVNFDGFLAYQMNNKGINSYCQIYRNGIVEFLSSSEKVFDKIQNPFALNDNQTHENLKIIYGDKTGFEYYIIRKSYEFLKIIKKFRIQPPIYIFITIIGAKGYRILYTNKSNDKKVTATIDRHILSLPEIEYKDYNYDYKKVARESFNLIWNSCGEIQSKNYNELGDWIGKEIS